MNTIGTFNLLEAARNHYDKLESAVQTVFRFPHISNDKVYGSLGDSGFFRGKTPYEPNSPYSPSKALSARLVHAWQQADGLPTVPGNCSNNYALWQFSEN